jgi:ankyrin repeat protein
MKLLLWIVPFMILASVLQRSSYAVSPKQAKLDSLLFSACSKSDSVAVRKLLKAGANIYGKVFRGYSIVEITFIAEPEEFEMLVRCGAKITRSTPDGTSLLHLTTYDEESLGQTPARLTQAQLSTLLASTNDVNAVNGNGQTPLHLAAMEGMTDLVKQLVEHGANINARDTSGATPLHYASGRGLVIHTDVVWDGFDPLSRVKKTHDARLLTTTYLIDHGADINAIDHKHNLPLHWYPYDCDEFVQLALARGMRLDVRNDENETVLHTCAHSSLDGSAVAALIAAGMDINAVGQFGQTPIFYTLWRNRVAAAQHLIDAKADLAIRNEFGKTVYDEAVNGWNRQEIAAMLRKAGAPQSVEVEHPQPPKTELQQVMEEVEKLRKK